MPVESVQEKDLFSESLCNCLSGPRTVGRLEQYLINDTRCKIHADHHKGNQQKDVCKMVKRNIM